MVLIDNLVPNTSKSLIITKHLLFGIVITWLNVIQTLQVVGHSVPECGFEGLK